MRPRSWLEREKLALIAKHSAAPLVAVAAAVLMTWPLALRAGDHVLSAIYYWDAFTNAMIMGGHVDASTGRGPLSLHDNYFFAPLPNSIVFNENLFGLSLLYAPFYLIGGNPLWAYNLTLLVSLSLSVFFTYLLVRRLTGSAPAGMLAGVAFAFSPYVMFELGRIQLAATQWIPACFWMLHRAVEERRLRDVAGLGVCYVLQIGTCLYYAMFLIPLLALVAGVLLFRQRPPRRLYLHLVGVGAVAGVVALLMVHPYFSARDDFSLERTLAFASRYDGKLRFFTHVHETNLTLTGLHHRGAYRGAHEEIAFPGFTVLAMLLLSLGVALWQGVRSRGHRAMAALVAYWSAAALLALAATVLARTMLAGFVVVALGVFWRTRAGDALPFAGRRGLYLALLLFSVAMFLGLFPMEWNGAPVRGLYYYFHSYFPGFDGIRKVSRQAVMTTFAFVVLSSFGSAWLFSRLSRPWARGLALAVLLGATSYELRSFPHPLQAVWSGETVPEAYRFMASLPRDDLVAALPQNAGVRSFRGDAGLALHNYLMLHHKHRSINGQSSFLPPVTDLAFGALNALPSEGARDVLRAIGTRHLLIHGADLPLERRDLPERLAAIPQHYRLVFQQGADSVFSFDEPDDSELSLLETPALPPVARALAAKEMRAHTDIRPEHAHRAVDGSSKSFWSSARQQARGQFFELALSPPQPIVAFEIENAEHPVQVPLSFELLVALGSSGWRSVAVQPKLRVYRDQVYSPKNFVFRIVLPAPTLADRVRLTVAEPVPGQRFTVHEARLYVRTDGR